MKTNEINRLRIEKDIRAFLEAGGSITEVDRGVSGETQLHLKKKQGRFISANPEKTRREMFYKEI